MGIQLRKVLLGALLVGTALGAGTSNATALSGSGDQALAKTGVLIASDLPAGWTSGPPDSTSDAEVEKTAKGVPGCAPYIAVQKLTHTAPEAKSRDFRDDSRDVSNTVDVFKSTVAADAALALYDKSSVPGCLEGLFTKVLTQQFAKDKSTKGKVSKVKVTIKQQPISGVGDDSVVYEGGALITMKDGSTSQFGIGNAAIQVGRAVSDFTYTTSSAELGEVVQPAIDSSIARLQAALTAS